MTALERAKRLARLNPLAWEAELRRREQAGRMLVAVPGLRMRKPAPVKVVKLGGLDPKPN